MVVPAATISSAGAWVPVGKAPMTSRAMRKSLSAKASI